MTFEDFDETFIQNSAIQTDKHAKRSKQARAEPVAALYEQGRITHADDLPQLEGELISWIPDTGEESPNRLDAMVYTMHELILSKRNVSQKKLTGV